MLKNRHWNLISLMLGGVFLDQGSKWLAKSYLTPGASQPILPNIFHLTLSYNTGAAFSMFRQHPQLLAGFTVLLFCALLIYAFRKHYQYRGELVAMGLILGGALGNLLDRLLMGKVTDFLDVAIIRYPIFNVADSLIFIGVFWLVILHLRQPHTRQPSNDTQTLACSLPTPAHDVSSHTC